MKLWMVLLFLLAMTYPALAQEQHTIAFGQEKITVNCNGRAPEGFCKTIIINSSIPLLVYFLKNDKTEANISGKSINIYYKKNENNDDVADVVIDGNNWWSARCVYFVTVWTQFTNVYADGSKMELDNTLTFDYVGVPFSVSKIKVTAQ
jgi:hypothetical protein